MREHQAVRRACVCLQRGGGSLPAREGNPLSRSESRDIQCFALSMRCTCFSSGEHDQIAVEAFEVREHQAVRRAFIHFELRAGIRFAVLRPVSSSGVDASLSPWMTSVGTEIFRQFGAEIGLGECVIASERRDQRALKAQAQHPRLIAGEVSGTKNGSALSASHPENRRRHVARACARRPRSGRRRDCPPSAGDEWRGRRNQHDTASGRRRGVTGSERSRRRHRVPYQRGLAKIEIVQHSARSSARVA